MARFVAANCLLAALLHAAAADLTWPDAYTVTGTIQLPYGDIEEPFVAWVDTTNGKSRQDTYNGTARIINRADMGDYGMMFKIVPETTQDFANRITCFKISGVKGFTVAPQSVLPDTSQYKYYRDMVYKGINVELYISNFLENGKNNTYKLYVRKDNNAPVLLHFTGYDRLFGSHYDEYIVEYDTFTVGVKNDSVFDFQQRFTCINFPGPGVTNPMSENLFFEFMGAEGYKREHQGHRVDEGFEQFKKKHERTYLHQAEEAKRKTHFRHNYRYIESMNRRDLGYKLAVNHIADLSRDEMKKMRGYRTDKTSPRGHVYMPTTPLKAVPDSINWRLRGAVTPVKDQGICGSCWSFGTSGTIEGSYFIKHGILIAMSEQAMMDCSWGRGNNACDGGESERAYRWIMDNGCLPTEASYGDGRYLMQDGYCKVNDSVCGAVLSNWHNTPSMNITALVIAIYEKGPISVAIDASHDSFGFYSHGVYYEPKCGSGEDDLDHQVLAVGYGTMNDQEYWLIKNSWSTHWGMDGYILMSRKNNNCGVATDASFADIV